MPLSGKKIIVAITGSIAAYKTPQLVRMLLKAGADVRVILTPSAEQFVTALSLSTVSRHPVLSNVSDGSTWNDHVEMGRWADVMLVAPCSANTLAKLAGGLCDNLVCAVYLSSVCPVVIAPAMDEDMWLHAATRANIEKLRGYGNQIIPVGHGELASGLVGDGRMAEVEDIVHYLTDFFSTNNKPLKGKKALVTAGPTYERIDPVRFIGNFSTGKMGIAIAEALAEKGAKVQLVLGPSQLKTYTANIEIINVESAEEMYQMSTGIFPDMDIAILSAAVADYTPLKKEENKIKKTGTAFEIKLVETKDILATLGSMKKEGQYLVGFALETENEIENAVKKLEKKNADMIVLNSLKDEKAGFGYDTNKVTLISREGVKKQLPLLSKKEVAAAIVNTIIEQTHETVQA